MGLEGTQHPEEVRALGAGRRNATANSRLLVRCFGFTATAGRIGQNVMPVSVGTRFGPTKSLRRSAPACCAIPVRLSF